jgi:iron complex transport system substrate-binding protein
MLRGGGSRQTRIYMSNSGDISYPCVSGTLSGDVLDLLGANNVAGTGASTAGRLVTNADLLAWQPDIVVVGSAQSARELLADATLQSIPAIARRRVHVPPGQPFSWSMRPPSINRLLGAIWLAGVAAGVPIGAEYRTDMRRFFRHFYQFELDDAQLTRLLG